MTTEDNLPQSLDEISLQRYSATRAADEAERMAKQRATVAAQVLGRDVTWGELSDAFDRVKNQENWKYPISAEVATSTDGEQSAREIAVIREAIIFFTGSVPEWRHVGNFRFRFFAVGYYAAVGA